MGEDVLLHLFTRTSIFIPLPNGCLCQVTGEYIFNLAQIPLSSSPSIGVPAKRKTNREEEEGSRPSKQRKLNSSGKSKKKCVSRFHCPLPPLILLQTKSCFCHFGASSALLCPPKSDTPNFCGFSLFAQKTYVPPLVSGPLPQSSRRRYPESDQPFRPEAQDRSWEINRPWPPVSAGRCETLR